MRGSTNTNVSAMTARETAIVAQRFQPVRFFSSASSRSTRTSSSSGSSESAAWSSESDIGADDTRRVTRHRRTRTLSSVRRGRATAGTVAAMACTLWLAAAALGLPPFTTGAKSAPAVGTAQAEVFGLAAGCHATFDRVVLRTRLGTPGYAVRYVSRVVRDPSGLPLPLRGSARLLVVLRPARAHTAGGAALLPAAVSPSCPNLLQVKTAGDFEGVVSLGFGLQRKTGFRVFRLASPARIVIDVAH